MTGLIIAGAYLGGFILCNANVAIRSIQTIHNLKKEKYDIKSKWDVIKKVCDDRNYFSFMFWLSLIPVANYSVALVNGCSSLFNDSYDYQNLKNELKKENIIKESPELLKLKSDIFLKEEKLKQAKDELGFGKIGKYTELSDSQKLNFINELENNIDNETQKFKAYNELTREEKIEFLNRERANILGDYEFEIPKIKKIGKRK